MPRKQTIIARPIARKNGLLVESVGEETVIYDLDSKEAHCLKALAASVFSYADGSNTAADIAELVSYRLGSTVTETEVAEAVCQLEEHALLDSPVASRDGMSRRDALRALAAGSAAVAGASMITTIVAPTAAAAGSQIPTGGCCGSTTAGDTCTGLNPKCVSNHCCQNISSKDCNQCKCVGDKNDCSTAQCSGAVGTCPDITVIINGVTTTLHPCASTSSGRCCYPDSNGNCCTVVPEGTTHVVVNC